jgi:uncharacterized protein YqgC (DUF456 family)
MKTLTRVYDSYGQAHSVVTDLEAAGISSANISLVANKYVSKKFENVSDVSAAGTGAEIGAAVGGGAGLLAGLGMIAIPGIGPVVAAGWLAATALGAVAGSATGGLIGALVGSGEPEAHAHVYSEAIRRGGTLVTVKVDDDRETAIIALLDRHTPIDPVTRRAEYGASGWKTFDHEADPYKPSQTEIERMRRNAA